MFKSVRIKNRKSQLFELNSGELFVGVAETISGAAPGAYFSRDGLGKGKGVSFDLWESPAVG